jgi:cysteine desulfurase / selenocysteine lyase
MTTPPATGDEVGLPDEATMNRLAGEFFSALPGGPPPTSAPAAFVVTVARIRLPFLPTPAPVVESVSGPPGRAEG